MIPSVSIVVPVHDAAATLPRCLDSLCGQTLREIEIICVDDASSDGSNLVLSQYAVRDGRVRAIRLEKNVGVGMARNVGIEIARGECVGFVDADDFVAADFYGRLFRAARTAEADVAKGTILLCSPDAKCERREPVWDANGRIKRNKAYFSIGFTSAVYNRKFLNGYEIRFPERLIHFEDPPFAIASALNCRHIALDDDAFYYYVENPLSASRNPTMRHIEDHLAATRLMLEMLTSVKADERTEWIVRRFLKDQLLAWNNRDDSTEEMRSVAERGLRELGLLAEETQAEKHFWRQEQTRDLIGQLRNKTRREIWKWTTSGCTKLC